MPWMSPAELSLDTAVDGDSVGTASATYTDDLLFIVPFTCSMRSHLKPPFPEVVKQFQVLLAAETNRRQIAAKMGAALADALNS